MEQDLSFSKEYYLLSIEIFKTLKLSRERRSEYAKEYLEKIYSEYCKLVENSDIITKKINDELISVDIPFINYNNNDNDKDNNDKDDNDNDKDVIQMHDLYNNNLENI